MLAKITKGQEFYGCLSYVLSKSGAEMLAGNMVGETASELAIEFRLSQQQHQRQAATRKTQKVVCHISLSVEIGKNLSGETWNAIAKDYLDAMEFDQNQYVLARHTDTEHDHVHLVVSRLRIDGTTVSDWLDYRRTEIILRTLEEKYQLRSLSPSWESTVKPPTVAEIRQFHRTQQPSIRTILQVAIDEAVEDNPTFDIFSDRLEKLGVSFRLHHTPTGIQGISYKFHNVAFPGYKLGKRYTWQGLQTYSGVQYESTHATTSQETATGLNPTIGAREHDFIHTATVSHQSTRTTRTTGISNQPSTQQAQTHSSAGQSRREVNARSTIPVTNRGVSDTIANSIGGAEPGVNEFAATFRGGDYPNEQLLENSRGHSDLSCEIDQGLAGDQRQPATTHPTSGYSNGESTETSGCAASGSRKRVRENSQPTSSTRPDQTQSNANLRTAGALQSFDSLQCDSDGILPVSSTQTAALSREATSNASTEVMLLNQDHKILWHQISEQVRSANLVEKDLLVALYALGKGLNREETQQLLWQSPYVQQLSVEQGYVKTRNYVVLTVKAAATHKMKGLTQQRPTQRAQQHTL